MRVLTEGFADERDWAMTAVDVPPPQLSAQQAPAEKGLKSGAIGLISSVVIGVASTAPAYSLAATLGLIAAAVGLLSPLVVLLAFIPMLFISIGYSELNKADPDCGTTFTWGTRTFGPTTGWLGGWGIIASDVLVMASLAQVTGQYVFFLFNANGIGSDATSFWVLLVGVAFIVAMTYVCYQGIELSAKIQRLLLGTEILIMVAFGVVALVRVFTGHAPPSHIDPRLSWFNPAGISFSALMSGLILMLFIYWGWDTSLSINEETSDKKRLPGLAGIIATFILLAVYALVTLAAQSFAGVGTTGLGLANSANATDIFTGLVHAVFGSTGVGPVFYHLLVLMILTSAAASTQTTILPTARTALSMAVYKAIPNSFAKMHEDNMVPTVATVVMGAISVVMYAAMNYLGHGNIILDSVTAIGIFIAFYYGLTGFTCVWYYRKVLTRSGRDLWMKGIIPLLGGIILYFAMAWSLKADWDFSSGVS
ncbi:MAG TPA: APC family permease, partial [Acidimicrobiales bacterium]|nr:APC family permease [Acidimicrobiales bacterium]